MTAPLAAGQLVAARYELDRPLATGHDASTWLAHERDGNRQAVLRWRAADAAGARLQAHVSHPALLAPRETLRDGAAAIDVFDFLPGGEISRLRGRPWTLVLRRLLPVADALQGIHAAGWVHGDVKSANVLLDADGLARLIDLGSAQPIGSVTPQGGSPYSMSPERWQGAPVSVADDVYAFGTMLHELITGHPPFYPDITPQRVRNEQPHALVGNPPPPGVQRDLVAGCLAKSPTARPQSMGELADRLQQALAAAERIDDAARAGGASDGHAPPPSPAWSAQPPTDAAPIRAAWHKSSGDVRDDRALRREGFRRGLLAAALLFAVAALGFVAFVLPRIVAETNPEPVAAKASAAPQAVQSATSPPAATPSLEEQAEQMRRAQERRAPLAAELQQLEARDVGTWGGAALVAVRTALAAGDTAFAARDFRGALTQFDTAAGGLEAMRQRAAGVLGERLASARAAFDAGRAREAQEQYAAALRVDPGNAVARQGLERARTLDSVLRELSAAATSEQAGDTAAAMAASERALRLDPATAAARAGIARLRARASGDAYAAAVATAQAALARRDYAAAQAGFERAGRLRPGASEVAEGLEQVRRAAETRSLSATLQRALDAERAERWSESLALYRDALKTDAALRAAQEGVERVEPRAMLDAELQSFLDRPDRLYSTSGRDVARNVLERARATPGGGPRLRAQMAQLAQLLQQAETPIRVALASDNATEVQIYRVGKLGQFEQRDIELMPGRYTVVGTRAGYRDVRKELQLLPGAAPATLVVRCEEPI
jgi:tetratricopeptide (TPR) repeat protein